MKPPEEPKFNPEKYVVSRKIDITGDKLFTDDSVLTDKYGDKPPTHMWMVQLTMNQKT